MMRDRGLGDIVAGPDVAGADRSGQHKLPQDGQSRRVRGGLEQEDVRIRMAFHPAIVLTSIYLDKYQYTDSIARQETQMTAPIHDVVRQHYARAALTVHEGGCSSENPACCGTPNYSAEELASLPEAAALASLGCGNPLAVADLHAGERVLDLGSGGGIDVLLSAGRVGPTGRAFGLDMTDEMLALAQRNAADAGATNVEFLKGQIEAIPLPAGAVDVVISNCVINLAADKSAVFREIARVLRPGGRLGVSDIVANDALSADERLEQGSYVGCIAGALSFSEYEAGLRDAGLEEVSITPTHQETAGMWSAIVRARKPDGSATATIDLEREVPAAACC
jgi:arsenite methyltransferase